MSLVETYKKLVVFFDNSQTKTANALFVKQPSVSAWLSGHACMSAETAITAELVTNGEFKSHDLCPKLKKIKKLKQST